MQNSVGPTGPVLFAAKPKDEINALLFLVGLLVPFAGIIIWAIFRGERPLRAASALCGFLALLLFRLFLILSANAMPHPGSGY